MAPYADKFYGCGVFDERSIKSEYWPFLPYVTYEDNEPTLWIFGYGSLIWRPNVEFADATVGYIKSYAIRFWQRNTTHRGTSEKPGRVATLIHANDEQVWGKAFKLKGAKQINEGLKHLCCREMTLGGYAFKGLDFNVVDSSFENKTLTTITFIATPENELYTGPEDEENIASVIVRAKGKSGHNLEYLFQLTDSLRKIAPESPSMHLARLEDACHAILATMESSDDDCVAGYLTTRQQLISRSKRGSYYEYFCNNDKI